MWRSPIAKLVIAAIGVVAALAGRLQGILSLIVDLHPEIEIPMNLAVRSHVAESPSENPEAS